MSILLYAESAEGKFKKVALELASYAKKVADSMGTTVTALTVNATDVSELSKYGITPASVPESEHRLLIPDNSPLRQVN